MKFTDFLKKEQVMLQIAIKQKLKKKSQILKKLITKELR